MLYDISQRMAGSGEVWSSTSTRRGEGEVWSSTSTWRGESVPAFNEMNMRCIFSRDLKAASGIYI